MTKIMELYDRIINERKGRPEKDKQTTCEYYCGDKRLCKMTSHKTCKGCEFYSPTLHEKGFILTKAIADNIKCIDRLNKEVADLKRDIEDLNAENSEMRKIARLCRQYQFGMAMCIEGGVVGEHVFKVGEIYPVLGLNNGVHICYCNKDKQGYDYEPEDLLCLTWDKFAPAEGEQFAEQDGTIPPLFEPYVVKIEEVEDER